MLFPLAQIIKIAASKFTVLKVRQTLYLFRQTTTKILQHSLILNCIKNL